MSLKHHVDRISTALLCRTPRQFRSMLFRTSAATLGVEARRVYEDTAVVANMGLTFDIWKARGFTPSFAVDCGAYAGNWAELARQVWPGLSVAMIEPQNSKRTALEEVARRFGGRSAVHSVLVGREERLEVPFAEMETGSSVLEEISAVPRSMTTRPQTTLAQLAAEHGWPAIDLLKIDVQGYELEVLAGAAGLLAATGMIVVESSLVSMNRDAPLVAEVIAALDQTGFVMVDLAELHRRPADRCTLQFDAVFVRRDGPLMPEAGWA